MEVKTLSKNPRQEMTMVLIKPDGVKRGLIGEVISRIERRGLKIVSLEMIWAQRNQVDKHYPKDKKWTTRVGEKTLNSYKKYGINAKKEMGTEDPFEIGQMVREWLLDYLTSGPIVKMAVKGNHAIEQVRKMGGNTMPAQAELGTIRGDYSVDDPGIANREKRAVYNIVHISETPEEADHELHFWIANEDIFDYDTIINEPRLS
ncbi:MAG: nucleoside-diphosphate kinase [Patescibacteria group bacterium]